MSDTHTHNEENMQEVLDAINTFASHVEKRFQAIEARLTAIEQRLDSLEQRVSVIEATIVTKDYLDEKLFDVRADFRMIGRRVSRQITTLTERLYQKKVIFLKDRNAVLQSE